MADEKISDMVAATVVDDTDIIPIVQGGTNKKATRQIFLTAEPGGLIQLVSSTAGPAQVMSANGFNFLSVEDGIVETVSAEFSVTYGAGPIATIVGFSTGGMEINFVDTQICRLGDMGGNIQIVLDGGSGLIHIQSNNGFDGFVGSQVGTNWAGGAPTSISDNLNRLAAAVAGLLGGTIP